MPTLVLTDPVNDTTTDANLIANNNTAIKNIINGGISNDNINGSAAIAYSKLALAGSIVNADVASAAAIAVSKLAAGSDGQVLATSGSTPTWTTAALPTYHKVTSGVDVVSSASETDLVSQSIAGGVMGTNKLLRATLLGDYLHNNSGADTMTLRVKFGGTTFWGDSGTSNAINATRKPWRIVVEIANLGANNSQYVSVAIIMGGTNSGAGSVAGIGGGFSILEASVGAFAGGITTLGTIDTSTSQTFAVSAQWSASSANNSWRMRYALIEVVG